MKDPFAMQNSNRNNEKILSDTDVLGADEHPELDMYGTGSVGESHQS